MGQRQMAKSTHRSAWHTYVENVAEKNSVTDGMFLPAQIGKKADAITEMNACSGIMKPPPQEQRRELFHQQAHYLQAPVRSLKQKPDPKAKQPVHHPWDQQLSSS